MASGGGQAWVEERVCVVSYDAGWPGRFVVERESLAEGVGPWVVGGIHHVGSTAVPGLAAKPVIDILIGVADLPSSRACIEPLARLGYVYAAYRRDEMHWFCKPHPSRRTHHLHLVPAGSPRFRAELAFRDHLRAHPDVCAAYASLKRQLGARFEHDREAYTEGKADFIRGILEGGSPVQP